MGPQYLACARLGERTVFDGFHKLPDALSEGICSWETVGPRALAQCVSVVEPCVQDRCLDGVAMAVRNVHIPLSWWQTPGSDSRDTR